MKRISLTAWILIALVAGIAFGAAFPGPAKELGLLGTVFLRLIKSIIAPLAFSTIVVGIAGGGDLMQVGRMGWKSLLYFEVVSSIALLVGLIVGELLQPGAGFNVDPATLDPKSVATYVTRAKEDSIWAHLLAIIPSSYFNALSGGDLLQVLLVAILSGFAITHMGETGEKIAGVIDTIAKIFFGVIRMIVRVAPIGAFGAMAFTIGKYGVGSLKQLGFLMACVYLTCFAFVFIVLGAIARFNGFSIFKFLAFIKEEIVLVLGTSSSESALPGMMKKMEHLGCAKPVVGMVIPTGYSFNLDGTSIYLTMAAIFIAQATNVQLSQIGRAHV